MKIKHRISVILSFLLATVVLVPAGFVMQANASDQSADFAYYAPSGARSMSVTYYDPQHPEERKEIPATYSSVKIPAGWLIDAEIVMDATRVITATGSRDFEISDFTISSEGQGKNAALTYTLKGFDPQGKWIRVSGWQTQPTNYAQFVLNGGTWTDERGTDLAGGRTYYQLFITPYDTVYKPSDPVREGYEFKGWVGDSMLDPEFNAEKKSKKFTADNPYAFDEVDPNIAVKYVRGRIVNLYAEWEQILPELTVEDKEIFVGDDFDPKDLLKKAVDYADTDLTEDVVITGAYRVDKPGSYPLTYTVTDKNGGEATKTATLTVKQKPAKLITPPAIDPNNVTIKAGEDLDLTSLYKGVEEGTQVFLDPSSKFNTAVPGKYTITLVAINEDGAKTTKSVELTVEKAERPSEPGCVCAGGSDTPNVQANSDAMTPQTPDSKEAALATTGTSDLIGLGGSAVLLALVGAVLIRRSRSRADAHSN